MKIRSLVTGGLGFIGSHLCDELILQDHSVEVIDDLSNGNIQFENKAVKYHRDSILDLKKLTQVISDFKPDYVFHLAALPKIQPSFENPILYDDSNLRGTLNLLKAIQDSQIKIKALVFSSSSSVYGNTQIIPTPEAAPIDPLSPYALQKFASERYLKILGHRKSIPTVNLRYFNVYGPRSFNPKNTDNAYSSVIGIFKNLKSQGKPLTITGDGSQERDFVHVKDVVAANILVAQKINQTQFKTFNVGTGSKVSVQQIADYFECEKKHIPERLDEIKTSQSDSSLLKSIGWTPTVDVATAIRKGLI
jgi:UDP-glucose 4-epimerase